MNKEKFLSGTPFYTNKIISKGTSTLRFKEDTHPTLYRQIRSSINGKIIIEDYEAHIDIVTNTRVYFSTHVVNKTITGEVLFKDMTEWVEGMES
jgi:hypothetical protein